MDVAIADQKVELINSVTDLMVTILGKSSKTTVVIIDEVDNYCIGGESLTVRRSTKE